jgi:hypothetical protein
MIKREDLHESEDDRKGFVNIFLHAAAALRNNKALTIVNVLAAWKKSSDFGSYHTEFYQQSGTNVENSLSFNFEEAKGNDIWFREDVQKLLREGRLRIRECRNDQEFGFVAMICGLPLGKITPG